MRGCCADSPTDLNPREVNNGINATPANDVPKVASKTRQKTQSCTLGCSPVSVPFVWTVSRLPRLHSVGVTMLDASWLQRMVQERKHQGNLRTPCARTRRARLNMQMTSTAFLGDWGCMHNLRSTRSGSKRLGWRACLVHRTPLGTYRQRGLHRSEMDARSLSHTELVKPHPSQTKVQARTPPAFRWAWLVQTGNPGTGHTLD